MMRPSVQGVDHPVCCVLGVAVAYARDSFLWIPGGPFDPDTLAPVLHMSF